MRLVPVLVLTTAVAAATLLADGRADAATVADTTSYECTDAAAPGEAFALTVQQTTTHPDSVATGGAVTLTVDALTFVLDEAGATRLRTTGATGASGTSTSYEFGYGTGQGVLSLAPSTTTVAEQPLGTSGPLTLAASGTTGATPPISTATTLFSPFAFDLQLALVGGAGGTSTLSCTNPTERPLGTVAVTAAADTPTTGNPLVVGLGALVVVGGLLAVLLRLRGRRG